MQDLQYSPELLAPLTGLTNLHHLGLCPAGNPPRTPPGLEVVVQLTWLKQLFLTDPSGDDRLLLPLAQLQQLTHLTYSGRWRPDFQFWQVGRHCQ